MQATGTIETWRYDGARLVAPLPGAPAAPFFDGLVSEAVGAGMQINRFHYRPAHDQRLLGDGPPTFCLAIFLDGDGMMTVEHGRPVRIGPGTMVVFHATRPVRGENFLRGGATMRCVDLRFDPALLATLGSGVLPRFAGSLAADHGVPETGTTFLARPTPAVLETLARAILDCRLEGLARRLFLQAKALEALSLLLATADPGPALPARERQRVMEARALLTARYDEPWTIAALARAVGLNEKKLKSGFRRLVGRSIHVYLQETRLAAARDLLAGGSTVTQAALAAGYANPSHFAKLFRRAHGVPPGRFRRDGA